MATIRAMKVWASPKSVCIALLAHRAIKAGADDVGEDLANIGQLVVDTTTASLLNTGLGPLSSWSANWQG